ncbi:bifunctional acetate--CoA ligase family protein/GNAT family N-acetyltransferase [Geodermatophilus marinus]|uniref:bifunctional acetate--CoA ligase family protein/GNAT family N-acetyltransferase n=1 Tax=Geodermatophilus sp. LHW52908 TaxID=2303986 RepID=UPI00131477C7|nr:GNAT family N-acetyltransferase [Geodermatophilus sp. LHW52908]
MTPGALAPGALALGAVVRGRVVGTVRMLPVGGEAAEVGVVVAREWRDHGVATALLEELAAVCLRAGIRTLLADVPADDGRTVRVLSDLGLPLGVTREGPSLRIEVALHRDARYAAATEERHRRAAAASLRPVLRPRSVAVVGAGSGEHSVGRAVLRRLKDAGFPGAVLAVNPHAAAVEGVPCRPRVADLPCGTDLVVVAVPAGAVAEVVRDCGERGVRGIVLLSSGLAAVPGLIEQVARLVDEHGMRLVGPNTVGVVGPGGAGRLDTTFAAGTAEPGDVGLVAQSGGIAIAATTAWQHLGLGLSAMVAVGDALDVGVRDVLAWFDEDPGTSLVAVYAESEPDLRGLVPTAAHLAARVPVVALTSGTSPAGRRAATSHTAGSATPEVVREAAYTAAGIASVGDPGDLATVAALLRGQPLPGTRAVAVLTNVGGGGVLAADACVAAGLRVDPLPGDVQEGLRALLSPLATTGNPVDTGAAVDAPVFADALRLLLDSPAVGAVVTVTAPTAVSDPAPGVVAGAAAAAAAGRATPVVDVRLTRATTVERLELPGAPEGRFLVSVTSPAAAARALAVAARRREWLTRPAAPAHAPASVDVRAAREALAAVLSRAPAGDWLLPPEVSALCRAAGLRAVPSAWVRSADEARTAARTHRGPVVVKGYVAGVVHKGDAGYLRLPVDGPAEAAAVVAGFRARAGEAWLGAVVQPLVPPGDELLVGAVRDPSAGPVVVLGPGGRATDALGHRVHRLAPVGDADAEGMLDGTGLCDTAHGRALDRPGVTDCVRRVGWIADVLPEVAEIEVNPLVATSRRATALDVRVRVEPPG